MPFSYPRDRYRPVHTQLSREEATDFEIIAYICSINCDTMDANNKLAIEENIIKMLRTVYDPEIPVNIYDLGLVYKVDVQDDGTTLIDMTLTAPNCPAADFIMEDVRMKVESVDGVRNVEVNLVFEPEWDRDMMTEEAKLELGLL